MTNILGISAFYHDSAAALVIDGEIVAAAQEERFTRKKHDSEFPKHAVDYCLREAGISPEEDLFQHRSASVPQEPNSDLEDRQTEFEQAGHEQDLSLVQEFYLFITENKKWWMLPIVFALGAMGLLVALSSTGAAPFIYTLF